MNEVSTFHSTSIRITFYVQLHDFFAVLSSISNPICTLSLEWTLIFQQRMEICFQNNHTNNLWHLHNRCLLLSPKETLGVGFLSNIHMLGLFSLGKCCNTDPTETLCGSVGKDCTDCLWEEWRREIRASLFPFGVMQHSLRGRNQRMGSSKDIEWSYRPVWVSGYPYWHETTKLNSVQLNPPFCVLKVPLFQSRQKGKINSVCTDINVQHCA